MILGTRLGSLPEVSARDWVSLLARPSGEPPAIQTPEIRTLITQATLVLVANLSGLFIFRHLLAHAFERDDAKLGVGAYGTSALTGLPWFAYKKLGLKKSIGWSRSVAIAAVFENPLAGKAAAADLK